MSDQEKAQYIFWRVEGSLLNLTAVRPVAFFTWNAQSFAERWARRGALALSALFRPLLYATNRVFATRVLHILLRGVSRDRLDLLGEEYFHYVLKPRLKPRGVEKLRQAMSSGKPIVLVSQGLDHLMRPLAQHLGVEYLIANRLEFRDGLATGRLLEPVIRPRGGLARITGQNPCGQIPWEKLCRDLGLSDRPELLSSAIIPAARQHKPRERPIVIFEDRKRVELLSVRRSLSGKKILLAGSTGFIGKVWLAKLLEDLPEIGKIYLLIRPQRSASALERFEKMISESPAFEPLYRRHGAALSRFLEERIEVLEGDLAKPGLGLDQGVADRLARELDLVVNSSGLTDFNPDLRTALSTNVDAVVNLLEFVRRSSRAGLLHLSTCYVVGFRDGRIAEKVQPDYTPSGATDFDAHREWRRLHELVRDLEARSKSSEVTKELSRQLMAKLDAPISDAEFQRRLAKLRGRWLRDQMVEAGMRRARQLGWPNTYTFTKSLAESLIVRLGSDLPVAIVRPSIVETSIEQPFRGWNEGVNTSAPISYLLGTFFRQLPSNERKGLDVIPVDLVCRGITLIAAAIIERCHEQVYQLATSARNLCDMRRSIELTALAHRKYYRAQNGLEQRLRAKFEAIPVSKSRYQKLSVPGQRAILRAIQKLSPPFVRTPLIRRERNLDRVEKLIELYEPFILHNEHIFEAENIELLARALPPEEIDRFGYDSTKIDWWEYWINIHIPALRKWSYPILEGRPPESPEKRPLKLSACIETRWPYS
jgi:long-chain acyl-CoA synthetase